MVMAWGAAGTAHEENVMATMHYVLLCTALAIAAILIEVLQVRRLVFLACVLFIGISDVSTSKDLLLLLLVVPTKPINGSNHDSNQSENHGFKHELIRRIIAFSMI